MSGSFFDLDWFNESQFSFISNRYINLFISLLTCYIILDKVFTALNYIWSKIRRRRNFQERYGKGTWAFVTGGSDGIGKELCNELAREGFNLFIVARTKSKLEEFSEEIIKKYRVLVQIKAVDFTSIKPTYEEYKKEFGDIFSTRDFSILVNNVGLLIRGDFLKTSVESINNTIKVNTFPQILLTKLYLEDKYKKFDSIDNKDEEYSNLINKIDEVGKTENNYEDAKQKAVINEVIKDSLVQEKKTYRCAIINLSSIAAQTISAKMNIYGSTKTFNDYLSKGLSLEYPHLDILSVRPGFVETGMSGRKQDLFKTVSPKVCASGILDNLGYEYECNGCTKHDLSSWFVNFIPEWLNYKISFDL